MSAYQNLLSNPLAKLYISRFRFTESRHDDETYQAPIAGQPRADIRAHPLGSRHVGCSRR